MNTSKKQTTGKILNRRQILKYGLYGSLAAAFGTNLLSCKGRNQGLRKDLPNVILISIDTLRADHLGCYRYQRATSPIIDSLSKEAIRFEKAYSQTSWTLPSHMSMLTSQYPHVHGVETEKQALLKSTETLAETLSKAGYYTSAFISWIYVSKHFGFEQGFHRFTELLPPPRLIDSTTRWSCKAEQVTNTVLKELEKKQKKPFFLFIHYFDPHINYEPPSPYDKMFDPDYKGKAQGTFQWISSYIKGIHPKPKTINPRDLQYITALYDGEIRYTDTHIGLLLKGIDKMVGLDNCLLILTSDHGEELNEHGSMEGHQWTLYDEVVHVPLIFRFPQKAHAATLIDRPVELIDIAPTILDYLGIPKPAGFQGRTLMGIIKGQNNDQTKWMLFAETRRHTVKQSVRTERYKLIHTDDIGISKHGILVTGGYEMYDMKKDPREQNNIYDTSSPTAQTLASKLDLWSKTAVKTNNRQQPEVKLSPEEIERLRSLGYVD